MKPLPPANTFVMYFCTYYNDTMISWSYECCWYRNMTLHFSPLVLSLLSRYFDFVLKLSNVNSGYFISFFYRRILINCSIRRKNWKETRQTFLWTSETSSKQDLQSQNDLKIKLKLYTPSLRNPRQQNNAVISTNPPWNTMNFSAPKSTLTTFVWRFLVLQPQTLDIWMQKKF